jgi:hypothetical protein
VAFLDDSGFNIQRSACATGSETTGSETTEPDTPAEEIAPLEPESPDFEEAEPGEAGGDNAPGSGPGETTAPPMGEPETDQRWWLLAAAVTAVFALMVALFLRRRRAPALILKGVDQAGAKLKRSIRFSAPGQRMVMEHGGAFLHFELRGGQVFISDPGSSVPGVALIVNDTPCLPEESFRLHEGDKLQWGENRFTVRLKLDAVRK